LIIYGDDADVADDDVDDDVDDDDDDVDDEHMTLPLIG
jgi:hypothetical protein